MWADISDKRLHKRQAAELCFDNGCFGGFKEDVQIALKETTLRLFTVKSFTIDEDTEALRSKKSVGTDVIFVQHTHSPVKSSIDHKTNELGWFYSTRVHDKRIEEPVGLLIMWCLSIAQKNFKRNNINTSAD
jgi:hypothetical protein